MATRRTALSRRQFITLAGGAAGAAVAGSGFALAHGNGNGNGNGVPLAAASSAVPTAAPTALATPAPLRTEGRTLIVVTMAGGNDGLNTLVPINDGRYRDLRPNLALAESSLLSLGGAPDQALHPSLAPMSPLWESGQLAALQAIGLPGQSRSHFVATDAWSAGGAAHSAEWDSAGGGWLGRWMDATAAGEPNPMRAISLGGGSRALVGEQSSPVIVASLSEFDLHGMSGDRSLAEAFSAMGSGIDDGLLGAARASIPTTVRAVEELTDAFGAPESADPYGEASVPAMFGAAADIIEADLGTQVIVINMSGFDTHANQLAVHAGLLGDLAIGISALFARLEISGRADRTLLMSYSEFGRRVAENGSGGTDHGSGVAFLVGPALARSQVIGDVNLAQLHECDVAQSVDSRSLYANALDWLGGPTAEILGGDWDRYDLLRTT
jgi:uncharacterized protein (DUF1501 family)